MTAAFKAKHQRLVLVILALLAILAAGAGHGLVDGIDGEDAEDDGHAGFEGDGGDAFGGAARDVFEVGGFAADDGAEADHGIEITARGGPLRGGRDFEGAGDPGRRYVI